MKRIRKFESYEKTGAYKGIYPEGWGDDKSRIPKHLVDMAEKYGVDILKGNGQSYIFLDGSLGPMIRLQVYYIGNNVPKRFELQSGASGDIIMNGDIKYNDNVLVDELLDLSIRVHNIGILTYM